RRPSCSRAPSGACSDGLAPAGPSAESAENSSWTPTFTEKAQDRRGAAEPASRASRRRPIRAGSIEQFQVPLFYRPSEDGFLLCQPSEPVRPDLLGREPGRWLDGAAISALGPDFELDLATETAGECAFQRASGTGVAGQALEPGAGRQFQDEHVVAGRNDAG